MGSHLHTSPVRNTYTIQTQASDSYFWQYILGISLVGGKRRVMRPLANSYTIAANITRGDASIHITANYFYLYSYEYYTITATHTLFL